ncbi:hotdog fold thioesterase [Luteipulveratus sp. YIM 133132]|uniref:Hotdog fold thioesterase n=1 Tax=Luteipulveratus flavus TaxID=3031728 RepID=A0ABT6CAG9_9MICO|nr:MULTISPECIES: hotdog fold thioesterase [unclassified Luteipulveratus]MDE9364593.1 hotdog fold thioesterase [Luteipulveratus sp. YIM 133132]MDF8265746.1 hotdog fold thioesterase [Luteipulveratus sp. YIM 133296]
MSTHEHEYEADRDSGLSHVHSMWAADHASALLGIELLDVGVQDGLGFARTRMVVKHSMVNGLDIQHGGYIFTLADSTFALACNAAGRFTVAAGADIVYVTSGYLGDVLIADARERATWGRSGITDVTVTREADGGLVAEFRGQSRSLVQHHD